jgi:hypothetical protein
MQLYGIDQMHPVSLLGKRKGMDPRGAAYVENFCRCLWKILSENRLCPKVLEFASLASRSDSLPRR